MSFSFGAATQQSAANTGFGSFGQTPAATPTTSSFGGFGQTTTAPTSTAIGQAPATSTPFGQTATSTPFGQAPATTTPFGQAPATSTHFGQNNSTTTPFGQAAATSTPFGGQTTTTPTPFGQTATSAPFGQPATSSSFSFGATPANSAPATSSSFSFGNNAGTTGGLFGNTANTTAKPSFSLNTPSLFGSKPNTTTTGFGTGFGQQSANANQQRDQQIYQLLCQVDQEARKAAAPSITSDEYKAENVWHALALLKSYWDPTSPSCRFKHYFYNVVSPQEVPLYVKPADHDQAAWDEAQAANPDRTTMVPALAIGFDDVQKRMDQQHRLSEAHSTKLAEIQEILKKIQLKDMLETATKLAEYKRRHMEAAQRVIKFLKYTQVLRNKGLSITPDEEVMRARLENIQDQLQRSEQFHGKLSQLWAQLQLIKESGRKYGKIDGVDEWDAVSENDMRGITKILEEQDNGVQHIIEVINKDTKNIDMIGKGWRA